MALDWEVVEFMEGVGSCVLGNVKPLPCGKELWERDISYILTDFRRRIIKGAR